MCPYGGFLEGKRKVYGQFDVQYEKCEHKDDLWRFIGWLFVLEGAHLDSN